MSESPKIDPMKPILVIKVANGLIAKQAGDEAGYSTYHAFTNVADMCEWWKEIYKNVYPISEIGANNEQA